MKKTKRIFYRLRHSASFGNGTAIIIFAVLIFGVAGTYFIATSHADTPDISIETESGTRTGNVAEVTDNSSSGASALSFGQSPGPCPSSTLNVPDGPDPWGGCWPGPATTGYPHGLPGDTRTPVTLTDYTGPYTINSCGVVINAKHLTDWLIIQAGNGSKSPDTPCVTITNSLVDGLIFDRDGDANGPVVIKDTEVYVSDLPFWENIGRNNVFTYRVNSHGGEGVVKCSDNCVVQDSWVHGMELGDGYHYNAAGGNGGVGFTIDHNYLSCGDWETVKNTDNGAGCSADIGFYGDFSPLDDITITHNFLPGMRAGQPGQPGYCLNPGYDVNKAYPQQTNEVITDNIFGRGSSGVCGQYGPSSIMGPVDASNGNVWSGNRYEDGTPIDRP